MDQVIAMDPDLADPHYFRGEAFRLQGEISESKLAFEQAILLDPTFAPAYLGLARIQLWEDPNTLPDALEQALSHDPTFLQAHLEKADHLARMNAWEQLEESARHALDAGVRTPLLSIRLGQAQFHLGKFQEALDRLLTGIIGDPNILESYLLLGQTLSELTRYEEAARPLQTYLTYRNQDPVGWAALGRAFYELGEYQRSLEAMNQALVWDAENPQYLLTRALINLQLSQPQDALTDLEQAVQLGLETEKIDLAISWAYYQLEAFDQAITRLTNLIDTSESPQILSDALQLRAKVYEQLSPPQLAEALADWRMILELEEVSPDIQASAELAIQRLSKIVVEGTSTPPVEAPDLSPSPPP
jgi:tetratricopeptide (TPR) repeat protein